MLQKKTFLYENLTFVMVYENAGKVAYIEDIFFYPPGVNEHIL